MNIENSIIDNGIEWDNSYSGVVDEFDGIDNGIVEDKLIERVSEIFTVDSEIKIIEEHLSRLKSYRNSVSGGIEHIMKFKKLNYPLILNSYNNYYEIKPMVEIIIHEKKFKTEEI